LDLQFGQEGEHFFTASSDNTVGMFDYKAGVRVKRMKGFFSSRKTVYPGYMKSKWKIQDVRQKQCLG